MMAVCSKLHRVASPLSRSMRNSVQPIWFIGASKTPSQVLLKRHYQSLLHQRESSCRTVLLKPIPFQNPSAYQTRNVGMLVARILKGALKIRYLLIGGAVTGGISFQRVSSSIVLFASFPPNVAKHRILLC